MSGLESYLFLLTRNSHRVPRRPHQGPRGRTHQLQPRRSCAMITARQDCYHTCTAHHAYTSTYPEIPPPRRPSPQLDSAESISICQEKEGRSQVMICKLIVQTRSSMPAAGYPLCAISSDCVFCLSSVFTTCGFAVCGDGLLEGLANST